MPFVGMTTRLVLDYGLVSVHPISPISLRSRGQLQFKYSFLPSPFETLFKDKIVTKLHAPKRTIPLNTMVDSNDATKLAVGTSPYNYIMHLCIFMNKN